MQSHNSFTNPNYKRVIKQNLKTNTRKAKKFYPTYLVDVVDIYTVSAEIAKNSTPCREK